MAWDADSIGKLGRENRAFGSTPFGQRCHHCGAPALTYGQDKNGDVVTDNRCSRCTDALFKSLKQRGPTLLPPPTPPLPPICSYCRKAPPLVGVWCGPCAIRYNEVQRDNGWSPKEQAEATIAYFRGLMDGSIKRRSERLKEPIENQDQTADLIESFNQDDDPEVF